MERSQCATAKIDLDGQHAKDTVLCMYAEFCRSCFATAQTMARHAVSHNRVYVQDLILAMRREVAHPSGSIHAMRPLLNYIFDNERLPDSALIPPDLVERIFAHNRGARFLRQSRASQEDMGDWLFECLTTGSVLCATNPLVYAQQTSTKCHGGGGGGDDDEAGTDEEKAADVAAAATQRKGEDNDDGDDDDEKDDDNETEQATEIEEEKNFKSLGREFCRCSVCASVSITKSYWLTYEPTDEIQQYLKQYCGELEERLKFVALDSAQEFNSADISRA